MDDALTVQMQVPPCRMAPMPAVWRLRQLYGAYARCMALMPAVWRLCQPYGVYASRMALMPVVFQY